jgi:cell wall-associated NlpC family hydrolase
VSQRSTARHRADQPASTPLTTVTEVVASAVTAPAATASRGGLVVAVSSGLLAGVGLPASTALGSAHELGAQTASVPLLSTAASTLVSESVTAPRDAKVTFEHTDFRATGKHIATSTPASASRQATSVSRSLARTAYQAQLPAPAPRPTARARSANATATATKSTGAAAFGSARGASVVAVALRYLGVPYVYGGATPRGFDCSGFTQYVYGLLGVSLPRSAQQQYNATTRISRSQAVPGDLVFFFTGGLVSHTGIYLGNNMMIAAPHTGDVVKRQTIYSANVAFGRV